MRPINAYADGGIADEPDDISVNELAEISEEPDETGLVEELSDQDEPEVISEMVYDHVLIDKEAEVFDADKAVEPAYSVDGGAYTYDADMIDTQDYKELFSAIYNDRRTELFGGRYYTGKQVVSLA